MNIDQSYFDIIDKKPYEILKIKYDISQKELIKVYRKLSKLYHPDRWNGNQEHFILVNKCYRSISNDIKNVRPNFIYEEDQKVEMDNRLINYKKEDITDQNEFNIGDYAEDFNKLKNGKQLNTAAYNRAFDKVREKHKLVTDRGYDFNNKEAFKNKQRSVQVYKKIQPVLFTKDKTLYQPLDGSDINNYGGVGYEFTDIMDAYRERDIQKEAELFNYRKDYQNYDEYRNSRNMSNNIEKKDYMNEYTIMMKNQHQQPDMNSNRNPYM